jgi:hypothetical protein
VSTPHRRCCSRPLATHTSLPCTPSRALPLISNTLSRSPPPPAHPPPPTSHPMTAVHCSSCLFALSASAALFPRCASSPPVAHRPWSCRGLALKVSVRWRLHPHFTRTHRRVRSPPAVARRGAQVVRSYVVLITYPVQCTAAHCALPGGVGRCQSTAPTAQALAYRLTHDPLRPTGSCLGLRIGSWQKVGGCAKKCILVLGATGGECRLLRRLCSSGWRSRVPFEPFRTSYDKPACHLLPVVLVQQSMRKQQRKQLRLIAVSHAQAALQLGAHSSDFSSSWSRPAGWYISPLGAGSRVAP